MYWLVCIFRLGVLHLPLTPQHTDSHPCTRPPPTYRLHISGRCTRTFLPWAIGKGFEHFRYLPIIPKLLNLEDFDVCDVRVGRAFAITLCLRFLSWRPLAIPKPCKTHEHESNLQWMTIVFVPWFLGFLVSWCLSFLVSWSQSFVVSKCVGFFLRFIKFPFHVFWKLLIAYPGFSRIDETDGQDLSVPVLSMFLKMLDVQHFEISKIFPKNDLGFALELFEVSWCLRK